jgi:alpha-1,3/alpha-1,6-mannosyltransferase
MRVAFIHPDLGIGAQPRPYILKDSHLTRVTGGAERLVVDAALGLQGLGHSVDLYTSYHDPQHCFDETRDGVWLASELSVSSHYFL